MIRQRLPELNLIHPLIMNTPTNALGVPILIFD